MTETSPSALAVFVTVDVPVAEARTIEHRAPFAGLMQIVYYEAIT